MNNNAKNDDYNKKIDNELKKKELKKKYDAHFSQSANIPPDLESEWLRNIEKFEQLCHNSQTTSVWERIGKPSFRKLHDLKAAEINAELQRLFSVMNENNIHLETLCEVHQTELYRFITEELFLHEMDDVRIEGMFSIFTYEDFHPNAEFDIRHAYDYFFIATLAKMENMSGDGYDLTYIDTKNYLDINGKKLEEEMVVTKFNHFLDSFDYFKIITNDIVEININKDKTDASLKSKIHYIGCFNNNPEKLTFEGTGIFKLKPSEYGGWDIYHLNIPGLQF